VNTKGTVGQFVPKQKTVQVNLSEGTKVINITLPNGVTLVKDIILNYDQVKGQFEQVGGKPNPDVPVVTPPVYGGGHGGSLSPSAEINSAAPYNGQLTLTANGSGDVTYGPAEGQKTVRGTVQISGNASGTIHLRNLNVTGPIIINTPNAKVVATGVEGNTIRIVDVSKTGGFVFGEGTGANTVVFEDQNGGRLSLPSKYNATRTVALKEGADALLEGRFNLVKAEGNVKMKLGTMQTFVYHLQVPGGKTATVDAVSGAAIEEIYGDGTVVNADGSAGDFNYFAAPTLEILPAELNVENCRAFAVKGQTAPNASVQIVFEDTERPGMFNSYGTQADENGDFALTYDDIAYRVSDSSYSVYATAKTDAGRSKASASQKLKVNLVPLLSKLKIGDNVANLTYDSVNGYKYDLQLNDLSKLTGTLAMELSKPGSVQIKAGEEDITDAVHSQEIRIPIEGQPEAFWYSNQLSINLTEQLISKLSSNEVLTIIATDQEGQAISFKLNIHIGGGSEAPELTEPVPSDDGAAGGTESNAGNEENTGSGEQSENVEPSQPEIDDTVE